MENKQRLDGVAWYILLHLHCQVLTKLIFLQVSTTSAKSTYNMYTPTFSFRFILHRDVANVTIPLPFLMETGIPEGVR